MATESSDITIHLDDPEVGPLVFDASAAGPHDGPLVLLLHGFPQTRRSWRHQLPALAAAGYRAVAVDQRGYSAGARPADELAYRQPNLVRDVLGFADALGAERFDLVGHDFGCVVGWQVACRHADRLRSWTAVSVPHPWAYLWAYEHGDQRERSGYFDWFRTPGSEADFVRDDCALLRRIAAIATVEGEELDRYLAVLGSEDAMRATVSWYRAALPEMFDGLGPVTCPTLHVWSTDDPALGREGAEATERYVEGPYRLEVIDGVDHWVQELVPDRFNEILLAHLASVDRG